MEIMKWKAMQQS